MSIDTTIMPPQFDQPWCSPSPLGLPLPGADDESLDLNIFDDLSFLDDSPLFPDALLDVCPSDMMEDFLGSSQVRHDCMWAGTCVDDNKDRPNPLPRLQHESPVKCGSMPVLTPCHDTPTKDTDSVPAPSVTPSRAKCNQRSILRTNLNLASAAHVVTSDPLRTASQEESDDSGRPDTPLSMEGSVPDPAEFKHDYELASSCIGGDDEEEAEEDEEEDDDEEEEEDDDEDEESEDEDEEVAPMVNAAEATGQTVRAASQHTSRFDSRPQQMAVSNHFFNDHSYHLSKDVSSSIPGNLTPSDSEDEIDVVSVCGEKSSSRSSSQSALPSNPSARDRHALQQTMASAMKRSSYNAAPSTYPSYLSGRQPSGKLARMQAERQRQRERKRRAQERDDSSEEDVVRPTKKRAKHHHAYKPVRRGGAGHFSKASSSDSEPDSCEKRSLHNNMERQRRVDLRNAFEDLRVVVPELSNNARAAKVVILKEASHYCRQLTYDSKSLSQESVALERERDRLLARVSFLRKQVACMRMGREA
ncbi:rRNA biogenesis protein rrp36-like [Thrips palmi]|uniref:rRNA biogenesis protein rrp36-like n=1 Tax=Thrips palmi TaxID=161013 RepID=A0A6P8ZZP6_THRPL|nr:rRNA biogenesis protein rrp36-like [Thrips palmi]